MWDKAVSIILVTAILGVIGTAGYVLATPKVGERFTEFYIFGPEGKAENYPEEIVVGEEAKVIVGILNREHELVTYWVEVVIDGVKNKEVGPLTLEHDDKWEEIISFIPGRDGDNQQVKFLLYKNRQSESYLELYLGVDVKE